MNNNDIVSYAYVVGLVLGALLILTVCYKLVKNQDIKYGGLPHSFIALLFAGMSVWSNISFSVSEDGISAELEKAIQEMEEEVAIVKQESKRNADSAVQLRSAIDTIKVQDALRSEGFYKGALSGTLNQDTVASIKAFQAQNRLSQTGKLDAKTIKKLELEKVNLSHIQRSFVTP